MRSLLLSCALVVGALLFIEGSHVFSQFLLQDGAAQLLADNLPASILTIVISTPVAVVALPLLVLLRMNKVRLDTAIA